MHPALGPRVWAAATCNVAAHPSIPKPLLAPLDFLDLPGWSCSLPANPGFSMLTYCEAGRLYNLRIYCTLCTMLLAALVRNFQPKA